MQFVVVIWSEDANSEPNYRPEVMKWQPKLKEVLAIEDPVQRSQELAKLGIEASENCANIVKPKVSPYSERAAEANRTIDAYTKRVFNDYIDKNMTAILNGIDPKNPSDPSTKEAMTKWMDKLKYICNLDVIIAQLANEENFCSMY